MSTNPSLSKPADHIGWIDLLRILACFLVVLAHCCDPFVGNYAESLTDFQAGAIWGSLVRPCVPLFAMISGVLLLPVKTDMGTFYKRRLKRIIIPLIVWSLALPLLYFTYFSTGITTANPNIILADYTWAETWPRLYTFIFNFNYTTTPLWYLYMLIGLYLFMPIMSGWLNQASRKDIKLFLKIWIVSMFFPALKLITPFLGYEGDLLGVCDWNAFGVFYYFSGFMGYIILAFYLGKYPLDWSWGKTVGIALPLFLGGFALTYFTFAGLLKYVLVSPDNFYLLEIPWWFSGITVFMMTFAIYTVVSKIKIRSTPALKKIAALTFGIYLCHFIVVQFGYDFVQHFAGELSTHAKIPLITIISFILSLMITWILSLTRVTRKSIM